MAESEIPEGKIILFPSKQEVDRTNIPLKHPTLLGKLFQTECRWGFKVTYDRGYHHLPICHTPSGTGCNPSNCTYELPK